jgi:hypothetical protein
MKPWTLLIILAMTTLVGACAGTKAAYRAAEGLEEKAYVVGEHYYALVREGNDLKNRGILSGSQLDRAQALVQSSRPVILELADATRAYANVKNAETEAELERALNPAALAVSRLVDVIKAVRPSTSENQHGPIDHRLDRAA